MIAALLRHLVESTVLALALVLVVSGLGSRSSAATRHALLLSAALKFALPLGALLTLGASLRAVLPAPVVPTSAALHLVSDFALPTVARSQPEPARWITPALLSLWIAGAALRSGLWLKKLRAPVDTSGHVSEILTSALRRAINQLDQLDQLQITRRVQLRTSPHDLEPRLSGLFRPTIVLPQTLSECLSAEELDAVLLHELAHVRRWDNLTRALVHTLTCIFWFYPLLPWLERRIDAEAELSCDEIVLANGVKREVYRDTLVRICQLYLLQPVAGSSSVTGPNPKLKPKLKPRLEFIMLAPIRIHNRRTAHILLSSILSAFAVGAVLLGFSTGVAVHAQTSAATAPSRPHVSCIFASVQYPEGTVIQQGSGPQQMCAQALGAPVWVPTSDEQRERSRQLISLPEAPRYPDAKAICRPTAPKGKFCTCDNDKLTSQGGSAVTAQGQTLACAAGGRWEPTKGAAQLKN